MAITWPTTADSFTNPTATSTTTSPSHAGQHSDVNDAVEAIEAYLGTNATQTTPTGANRVLTSSSATASTWSATPTLTSLTLSLAGAALSLATGSKISWNSDNARIEQAADSLTINGANFGGFLYFSTGGLSVNTTTAQRLFTVNVSSGGSTTLPIVAINLAASQVSSGVGYDMMAQTSAGVRSIGQISTVLTGATDASRTSTMYFGVCNSGEPSANIVITMAHNAVTVAPGATATGATAFTVTPPAHTAITAEVTDHVITAHTVTLADGTTIALARSSVFNGTTYNGVAAGGTETVTTMINTEFALPVVGTNLTGTNAPIAIRALGNTVIGNILTPAAGPTNTLFVASGTAPTSTVADSVAFYSSDIAAGHTEPSFYCEGTQVLATGQADSASSVRVKMRINGTEVTLLAI